MSLNITTRISSRLLCNSSQSYNARYLCSINDPSPFIKKGQSSNKSEIKDNNDNVQIKDSFRSQTKETPSRQSSKVAHFSTFDFGPKVKTASNNNNLVVDDA
ncbi:hypothetical protein SAMD00019534_035810, partial [Acytostelium subglobosum LB1]|uniref:hypothetical protein n=1 Tax=Acytostelium subglobosum LB1 TaxID=1410327 RepID=UPI0006449B27